MQRKYYKYTNFYMRYLTALHEGHAYYLMNIDGKYIIPFRESICFGSWWAINYVKLRYGTKAVNRVLNKSYRPCIDEIIED